MRTLAALSVVVVLVGCHDWDALTRCHDGACGDAAAAGTPDGGALGPEAGASDASDGAVAGSFCAGEPTAFFCDDFDAPGAETLARWDALIVEATPSDLTAAQSLTVDANASVSRPRSLLSVISTPRSSTLQATALKRVPPHARVRLTAALSLEASDDVHEVILLAVSLVPPPPGYDDFTVQVTNTLGAANLRVYVVPSGGAPRTDLHLPVTVSLTAWRRIGLELDVSAAKPEARVYDDGALVFAHEVPSVASAGEAVEVGNYAVYVGDALPTPWRLRADDVVVSASE